MEMTAKFAPTKQFETLTVDEARRLATMLALEEAGLEAPRTNRGNLHCVAWGHAHKAGNNTGSLQIRPREREADSETQAGDCKCYSQCGGHGSFSDYVSKIGQPGLAKSFWTKERVQSTVEHLKKQEPFSLGWLEWKKGQNLPCSDGARTADEIVHRIAGKLGGNHGYSQVRAQYIELFVDGLQAAKADPSIVSRAAALRGWKPDVCWKMMEEGILSLRVTPARPTDIQIGFAYRGLYLGDNSFPVRIIKTKYLAHKEEMTLKYAGEPTPVLADFTSSKTSIQEASMVIFAEGEPDCVTLRHMFPDAGIVCLGNKNQYHELKNLVPRLRLAGKEVVYAIDRDVNEKSGQLIIDDRQHLSVLARIKQENPKSLRIWMCPQLTGLPASKSKDINDFYKVCADPAKFMMAATLLETSDGTEKLSASYGSAVQKAFQRTATKQR